MLMFHVKGTVINHREGVCVGGGRCAMKSKTFYTSHSRVKLVVPPPP